ncbi:hypothetical protein HK405_008863, partial [Cladochytrium tenue]
TGRHSTSVPHAVLRVLRDHDWGALSTAAVPVDSGRTGHALRPDLVAVGGGGEDGGDDVAVGGSEAAAVTTADEGGTNRKRRERRASFARARTQWAYFELLVRALREVDVGGDGRGGVLS